MDFDPDVLRLFDAAKDKHDPPKSSLPIEEVRENYRRTLREIGGPTVPLETVHGATATGRRDIPLRVYRPFECVTPAPAVIFIHGGAFVMGDLESHDGVCRRLASRTECVVVAIDYRLAPEHPAPAAAEDVQDAIHWIAGNANALDIDPERMAIVGDSAGGCLTAVGAVFARDADIPLRLQVLLYPSIDNRRNAPAYPSREKNKGVPPLTPDTLEWAAGEYLPVAELGDDWRQSPILIGDKRGLPPALVMVAQRDPLCSEGLAYADALEEAGVPVSRYEFPGMIHGFITMSCWLGVTERALDVIASGVRKHLGV